MCTFFFSFVSIIRFFEIKLLKYYTFRYCVYPVHTVTMALGNTPASSHTDEKIYSKQASRLYVG